MKNRHQSDALPWYRYPWPWLLMAAPVAAIVWGMLTLWIAIEYRDPLVTEHPWEDGKKLELPSPPAAK